MDNNITNLSSFGFSNYYLSESGKVYKAASMLKEIQRDSINRLFMIDDCGNGKRITLKKLYKMVFNKEFCIDEIQNKNNEHWKPIDNTDGKYFISNCGRVKSYCGYTAILLKPYLRKKGYLEVKINGRNYMIHQLVAVAFCNNKYKGTKIKTETHHKNRNRQDNRAENLQILSVAEHHKEHSKKDNTDNE